MKLNLNLLLIMFCFFALGSLAQEPQPQAFLRLGPDCRDVNGVENLKPGVNVNKCYAVEIYMPESFDLKALIAKSCQNKDGNKISCPLPNFATIFNGKTYSAYRVELSPKDSLIREDRKNRIYVIYLPNTFPVNKPMQLMFDSYDSVRGLLKFPSTSVVTDYTVSFSFDSYNKLFSQKIELNKYPMNCADAAKAQQAAKDARDKFNQKPDDRDLAIAADDAEIVANYTVGCQLDLLAIQSDYDSYRYDRLLSIRNWLEKQDEADIDFFVEDLNKCLKKGEKGCISFAEWNKFQKELKLPDVVKLDIAQTTIAYYKFLVSKGLNPTPISDPPTDDDFIRVENMIAEYGAKKRAEFLKDKNLTIADLENFGIKDLKTFPKLNLQINADRRFIAQYETKADLPTKFNTQLNYKKPAPFELANGFKVTLQEMTEVTVNTREDTGAVGERTRPNRLDAAFQFGSSVDIKEEEVNGVMVKNIERTTRGTLDLRASAFRPVEPNNWFSWEPLFIDAKVSNGKITKDTLSLNRIVIGTSFDFTKFLKTNNASNPTYFNFNLKPVQASDRDFKQLEYKVIGEFQPRLSFLNRIPANYRSTVNRVISKEGDLPTRFVAPAWGYKIQPVFGGEIGKTWLRRDPAEAITPTKYIRRLYTKIDLTFYMPLNTSLSFSDKFYWNFGKDINGIEVDSQENIFKASLDIGIRKRNQMGDSIYISFEKGNEPPFGPRDKNIFKIGYRVVNPRFLRPW